MDAQQALIEQDGDMGTVWRGWLPAFCKAPLRDYALAKLIDLCSHGMLVASCIASTYVLAKGDSVCSPGINVPLPIPYQALVACTPILFIIPTVCLGAALNHVINGARPLNRIAMVSFMQVLVVAALVSWMMLCLTSISVKSVLACVFTALCMVVLAWSGSCSHAQVALVYIKNLWNRWTGGDDAMDL